MKRFYLRILVYLVTCDAGQVLLEHLLLSRYPSVDPINPESVKDFYLKVKAIIWP